MMANLAGADRKRCKATASFAMIKHTETLTDSGPMSILALGCRATIIVIKGRGVDDQAASTIAHRRKTHSKAHGVGVNKHTKRFAGVAGLERPLARLKSSFA